MWIDYEELILVSQEDDIDEDNDEMCLHCPVRGEDTCDNRCLKETTRYFDKELMRYVERS